MPKRISLVALAAAPLLALAACSSGPNIQTLSDPSVSFSQYQTFGFVEPLGTDRAGYQSIVSQHLKDSTRRQMEARGFRYDPASPQLLINFSAKLDDKMRVTTVPEPSYYGYGYYGYRRGFYQPWPMYTDRTEVTQYQQGTLTIDLVDAARKQLVWEGTATKAVSSKDVENVPATIESTVAAVFAKFPVPATAQ
ncbi:DUF4136 domain-containing protein [Sandaracinobacter sp. RS1-74]|uniref:DUF4136 domain-containing protein n=1 Tax=Sandaracinobacteroides sayramensis TaxID=2913411 RepID=UPI001EDC60CE|nr:DUF4136 domain-containing protein [Sandaracinobacteroides sayramensis]MCG2839698.1 DUF4136 domain-containing protein [Sandaracinobacteroides sayramensis]